MVISANTCTESGGGSAQKAGHARYGGWRRERCRRLDLLVQLAETLELAREFEVCVCGCVWVCVCVGVWVCGCVGVGVGVGVGLVYLFSVSISLFQHILFQDCE